MVEIPLFLEVAHGVANRGGGERVTEPLGNSPAPRRLGGFHVGLDDGFEDLALAVVQGCYHVSKLLPANNLHRSRRAGQGAAEGVDPEPALGAAAESLFLDFRPTLLPPLS